MFLGLGSKTSVHVERESYELKYASHFIKRQESMHFKVKT